MQVLELQEAVKEHQLIYFSSWVNNKKVQFPEIGKQMYHCIHGMKLGITSSEFLLDAISSYWWSATSPDRSESSF